MATAASVPMSQPRPNETKLPPDITALTAERNRARRRWQKSRHITDLEYFRQLNGLVSDRISNHVSRQWQNTLENLTYERDSVWKIARCLTREKTQIPPPHHNRTIATTDKQKADALADALQETLTPNATPSCPQFTAETEEETRDYKDLATHNKIRKTCPSEIKWLIKHLPKRKAPGPDGIPTVVLSNLPEDAIKLLSNIFNYALENGYYPDRWKSAIVAHFPKKGKDLSNPQNYRPISLLSVVGKLLEKVILKRQIGRASCRERV